DYTASSRRHPFRFRPRAHYSGPFSELAKRKRAPTRFLLAHTTVIVYVCIATMASGTGFWRDRYVKHTVLDWLLRTEPRLRRHRERVLVVIALMMTLIAAGDVRLSAGISLAFGYSFPIALGAYALG